MELGFQYYAFISYKHEDEKWAKWLQHKLENYKLPSIIRKEIPRLPRYIRPVFRDKTDLGVGQLTESLRKELELSQYLIVICSSEAAKSEWVGKEIDAFISMGRTDNIIPFISILVISVPIYSVVKHGSIYNKGLRKEGIIMKYDTWEIGEPCIKLNTAIQKKKNTSKNIHICSADGEFKEYNMEPEAVGLEIIYAPVEYNLYKNLKLEYTNFLNTKK